MALGEQGLRAAAIGVGLGWLEWTEKNLAGSDLAD